MLEKRNPPVGARPGTLAIPEGSPPPRIYLFDYSEETLVEGLVDDLDDLEPYTRTESTTWIDVQGMGDEAALWLKFGGYCRCSLNRRGEPDRV